MLSPAMIAALRCPLCHCPLASAEQVGGRSLRCAQGHNFDVAKQGYVHLGTGRKLPEGDTAPMVEARAAFLATGHFAPLLEQLHRSCGLESPHNRNLCGVATEGAGAAAQGLVVDLGAGTGYYLAQVLDAYPDANGIAFDVAKPALKRAAKAHPRAGAVLADTWSGLPLADQSVDLLLNIFAPRNGAEMHRVLRGVLVVVTPDADHLRELREAVGLINVDESKEDRLAHTLRDFDQLSQTHLTWQMPLAKAEADLLVRMGPNAHHVEKEVEKDLTVTASVWISTWRGRPLPSPPAAHGSGR